MVTEHILNILRVDFPWADAIIKFSIFTIFGVFDIKAVLFLTDCIQVSFSSTISFKTVSLASEKLIISSLRKFGFKNLNALYRTDGRTGSK